MKTLAFLVLSLFPFPALAGEKSLPWPPEKVAHVVAYVYDYTQDSRGSRPVFPDGSLHKGIIRSATARLGKEQAKRLAETLSKPVEFHDSEDCYDPHHAFVFYDAEWKPVGWFAVCWGCGTYAGGSDKFPEYIDLAPVRKLSQELAMPLFHDSKEYTKLFLQEQAPEEREKLRKLMREQEAKMKEQMERMKQDPGPDPFADEESSPAKTNEDPSADEE